MPLFLTDSNKLLKPRPAKQHASSVTNSCCTSLELAISSSYLMNFDRETSNYLLPAPEISSPNCSVQWLLSANYSSHLIVKKEEKRTQAQQYQASALTDKCYTLWLISKPLYILMLHSPNHWWRPSSPIISVELMCFHFILFSLQIQQQAIIANWHFLCQRNQFITVSNGFFG